MSRRRFPVSLIFYLSYYPVSRFSLGKAYSVAVADCSVGFLAVLTCGVGDLHKYIVLRRGNAVFGNIFPAKQPSSSIRPVPSG